MIVINYELSHYTIVNRSVERVLIGTHKLLSHKNVARTVTITSLSIEEVSYAP